MSSTTTTQYYGLTQYVGTDKPSFLDNNEAFAAVDAALHGAVTDVASQGETISGLSSTVGTLGETVTGLSNSLDAEKAKIVTLQNKEITQDAAIAEVKADALDMICANNEEAATSTHAYSVGDFFRYNDVLYKATDAITIGATIVPNVNCEATNVTEELVAGVDKIGDLTSLTTTDKTDAVAAINEVNSDLTTTTDMVKRGVVSVTADGVKNYSQVFNDLYALIDRTKLTTGTCFIFVGIIAHLSYIGTDELHFTSTQYDSGAVVTREFKIASTGSVIDVVTVASNGTVTNVNDSAVVPVNGTELTVQYSLLN